MGRDFIVVKEYGRNEKLKENLRKSLRGYIYKNVNITVV